MQCFNNEKILMEHKEIYLKINGKQSIKLRNETIKFKNYSKKWSVSFKIYADFESILKGSWRDNRGNNASYAKKYQRHIPCSFAYKVLCIDDRFSKTVVLYRGKKCNQ